MTDSVDATQIREAVRNVVARLRQYASVESRRANQHLIAAAALIALTIVGAISLPGLIVQSDLAIGRSADIDSRRRTLFETFVNDAARDGFWHAARIDGAREGNVTQLVSGDRFLIAVGGTSKAGDYGAPLGRPLILDSQDDGERWNVAKLELSPERLGEFIAAPVVGGEPRALMVSHAANSDDWQIDLFQRRDDRTWASRLSAELCKGGLKWIRASQSTDDAILAMAVCSSGNATSSRAVLISPNGEISYPVPVLGANESAVSISSLHGGRFLVSWHLGSQPKLALVRKGTWQSIEFPEGREIQLTGAVEREEGRIELFGTHTDANGKYRPGHLVLRGEKVTEDVGFARELDGATNLRSVYLNPEGRIIITSQAERASQRGENAPIIAAFEQGHWKVEYLSNVSALMRYMDRRSCKVGDGALTRNDGRIILEIPCTNGPYSARAVVKFPTDSIGDLSAAKSGAMVADFGTFSGEIRGFVRVGDRTLAYGYGEAGLGQYPVIFSDHSGDLIHDINDAVRRERWNDARRVIDTKVADFRLLSDQTAKLFRGLNEAEMDQRIGSAFRDLQAKGGTSTAPSVSENMLLTYAGFFTNGVRFVLVAFMGLLISVILGISRRHARLHDFYRSRADTLALLSDHGADTSIWPKILGEPEMRTQLLNYLRPELVETGDGTSEGLLSLLIGQLPTKSAK